MGMSDGAGGEPQYHAFNSLSEYKFWHELLSADCRGKTTKAMAQGAPDFHATSTDRIPLHDEDCSEKGGEECWRTTR